MSGIDLGGFDLVVQINEEELNLQFDVMPIPGMPYDLSALPFFDAGEIVRDKIVIEEHNSIPGKPNAVTLYLKAINVRDAGSTQIYSGGVIKITQDLTKKSIGNGRQFAIDLSNSPIIVAEDPALLSPNTNTYMPLLSNILPEIAFPEIPIIVDPLTTDSQTIKEIDAVTSGLAGVFPTGRCISFLVTMGGSSIISPADFPNVVHSNGNPVAVVLSNDYILSKIMKPALAAATGASFSNPCTLSSPYRIFHQSYSAGWWSFTLGVDVETMVASVGNGYIQLHATVGEPYAGYSVNGHLTIRLYPEIQGGELTFRVEEIANTIHFNFSWWVWPLIGLTGGALGILVMAGLKSAINNAIDDFIDGLSATFATMTGSSGLVDIPLGFAGTSMDLDTVILDDLIVYGNVLTQPASIPSEGVDLKLSGYWRYASSDVLSSSISAQTLTITTLIGHNYEGWFVPQASGFTLPINIVWQARNYGGTSQWIDMPVLSPGQTGQITTAYGGFEYCFDGNGLYVRNMPNDRLVALLRVKITDQNNNQEFAYKQLFAKLPTSHQCSFAEDVFPTTSAGGIELPGNAVLSDRAAIRAQQLTGLNLTDHESNSLLDVDTATRRIKFSDRIAVG